MIMLDCDEHTEMILVKDLLKPSNSNIIDIIPMKGTIKTLVDILKSRDVISIDGKVYEEVDPLKGIEE